MSPRDGELRARLRAMFRVEAAEHLGALRTHLVALADEPAPELERSSDAVRWEDEAVPAARLDALLGITPAEPAPAPACV
ncbi:MAG: hypothetical protein ACRDPC_25090, partial [Solirubrobacteraceae bacterium]